MNDITPPGRLPRPNKRPTVRLKDVRSAPLPEPPTPQPPQEPDLSRPLDLPNAATPDRMVVPPRHKRRWLTWLLIIGGLLVLLAGGAFAGYSWYQDALRARSDSSQTVRVTVDQGETADSVATALEQKGVIRSALAVQMYIKLNGKGNIKAGSYLFSPNQTPSEIVQWLNDGRVDTFKVTILPGQTLADIKKTLQKYNYTPEAIDAAFAKQYQHPLFADKPAGSNLEGYIFPDTYFVTSDITVERLLVITFDEFEKKINEHNLRAALAQQNLTLFKGITLASIIEKEVAGEADQRQVSQVFQKRLREGMVLGSDVTYHYGASLLGVAASPDIDSPYNTRKFPGLPPGPIGNFPITTLQAVAQPAAGDYLFFVAGDDGVTHFARTNQEHEQNVQQYCKKLCAGF
jgi:UPF0755 protein